MLNQKPNFKKSLLLPVHVMSEWSTLPCSEEVNPGHLGNNIPFFVKYYLVKQ